MTSSAENPRCLWAPPWSNPSTMTGAITSTTPRKRSAIRAMCVSCRLRGIFIEGAELRPCVLVRFRGSTSRHHALFDHLVSTGKQRWRHRQPQFLRGLQIDDEFISGWRLHWQVSRLFTPEDAIDVTRRRARQADQVRAIGNQAATGDEVTKWVDRG